MTEINSPIVPLAATQVNASRQVPSSTSIRIGQVFRVGHNNESKFYSIERLTAGRHRSGCDIQKGVFFYADVHEPGTTIRRTPAFLLYSNRFRVGTEGTPWMDIIEPDLGYALFHGDNRQSGRTPFESRGNGKFVSISSLYADPALRKFAPPLLLFSQLEVDGNRKGYREFSGFGVPVRQFLTSQREKGTGRYFTNLVLELALFKLTAENELFPWDWIDARRDSNVDADSALKLAPSSWKSWVRYGNAAVERCRRHIGGRSIIPEKEQKNLSAKEYATLLELLRFYQDRKHSFEALASLVATRIIGSNCHRAWITQRSADGGYDFVCRIELGDHGEILSRVPVVVLGQAKCVQVTTAIGGLDIARLVARLRRGWLGVFVTTGVFSRPSQIEINEDRYPVLLVGGKRLVREIHQILIEEQIRLTELLEREDTWYNNNLKPMQAFRALDDLLFAESD